MSASGHSASIGEPGSAIDFAAFDKYFLGRPRLDGIRVQFITDKGAMLGNLSAKSLQMMVTLGSIPEFTAMNGLKRDWEASGYGTVLMDPISYRFIEPQKFHNPTPADLTDPRVRRALLLAVDRPELARLAFADDGVVANSWVHPTFPYYPQVQDVIVSYPYDTRQASQLLADAGWRPGSDGTLEKGGQRFSMTMRDIDGERDSDIIASMWKQIGVVGSYELKTAAAIRDREDRATFTGIDLTSNPMGVAAVVRRTATSNLPTAENRWVGTNRGGYANPAWDALEPKLLGAIDDRDRIGVERDLLGILAADLPVMPLSSASTWSHWAAG